MDEGLLKAFSLQMKDVFPLHIIMVARIMDPSPKMSTS